MNGSLSALAALILAASGMLAQSPAARPKFDDFEVATIRPTAPDGGKFITMQSTHQFVAKNQALRTLVAAEYSLTPRAISGGPALVDSDRFDILLRRRVKYGPVRTSR